MMTRLFSLYFLMALINLPALAFDSVRFEQGQSKLDSRMLYKTAVIRSALEHTQDEYGPFELTTNAPRMNSLQAIRQIQSGDVINVFIALTNPTWEANAIPIRIPVRRGLLSYRLLLINKKDQDRFAQITTASELRKMTAGLRQSWSLAQILSNQDFRSINTSSYDGLFLMLERGRFDYIPRGINEIYSELEQRQNKLTNIMVEPTLALYIPTPTYIFVSPRYPELAQRLEKGMEMMVQDGTLKALFDKHYSTFIKQAKLHERRIIHVANPYLPELTPVGRKELWFDPLNES
jgi:hypothetical protein